ncbi:hypothetical protein C6I20_13385 [Aeromicrobium sp. A1-2]|uniref:hypothetical protein n=1 Tax=Aeromicrobium sp. A1-2 TaxID=2107713 RepID=UPI000E4EECAB|nr:hypothetical protein [Aeromicrobium sp. A1-2]AXT86080.1 hypothetical protein C6I20_13385 [Aeromicrobium sp. A1-2]
MHLRHVIGSAMASILVLGLVVAGGWWTSGQVAADTRSPLTVALDALPPDTRVAGFTNWARVRSELGLGEAATAAGRAALTDDAVLLDLSTRSVLGQYTEEMHAGYGWSAADLDWEIYGQANDGAGMVAQLDEAVSFASVRAGLEKLGYTQEGSVWSLGPDSVRTASPDLTATLASIVLMPRRRLIVAADRPTYISTVLDTIDRDAPSLLANRSAQDVARRLTGADTVLLQAGPFVCASTSLADQGAEVRAQASAAIDRAGALVAPVFAGRGLVSGPGSTQVMRFVMGFQSPSVAAAQLDARRRLATGPFIGRSGRIEDSLKLQAADLYGTTTSLRFDHDPSSITYMSGDGPLLFAGC